MKFSDLKINKNIQKAIAELNFINLTEIQVESIPFLLESNDDLIGLAQTGTGKTAAFSLPIIEKINKRNKETQCIVLCPTRELCIQITKDIKNYAKYEKDLRITPVYGGANIQTQIKALNSGSQIVIGTPGRVIDLIKRKKLKLNNIKYLILDEADEMLNMGFKDDIDFILAETPVEKQSLLFSATMPKEVLRIAKQYMHKAKHIEIANRKEGVKNIEHYYYMVNAKDRYKALRRICDINPEIYSIVFCRTRRETKDVSDKLMKDGYLADALNGDLSQSQRDNVMSRFRKKNIQLLIATDVAARGIDINDLTHVINYNLPDDNEVYIHRSGRTGRVGKKGISIIIAHSREKRKLQSIGRLLKKDIIVKDIPSGEEICKQQLLALIDKVVNTNVNEQIEKFLPSIEEKLQHLDKNELLKQFISVEFNRFLSFYKNAPDINMAPNTKGSRKRKDKYKQDKIRKKDKYKQDKSSIGKAEEGYSRFFINIGKKQNLKSHNLIGLINESTRKRNIPIGKIDILRKFSFFEVDSNFEQDILNSFTDTYFNGNSLNVELSQAPKLDETPKTYRKTKKSSFKKKSRKRKR
ncbi:MAG: DEAD/DEAH box helicase [Bacteroidota bacterium]|nr:DEAD/DEAH box helicase [Bacteroidota bacterium]